MCVCALVIPRIIPLLVHSCAAMPKERRRYASKCTDLVKQLEVKVQQYNMLIPFGQRTRVAVVLQDIRQCSFTWMEEYGEGAAGSHVMGSAMLSTTAVPACSLCSSANGFARLC